MSLLQICPSTTILPNENPVIIGYPEAGSFAQGLFTAIALLKPFESNFVKKITGYKLFQNPFQGLLV